MDKSLSLRVSREWHVRDCGGSNRRSQETRLVSELVKPVAQIDARSDNRCVQASAAVQSHVEW